MASFPISDGEGAYLDVFYRKKVKRFPAFDLNYK